MKTFIFLGLLCVLGMAHADVVTLHNGDRISGKVDSISGGRVLIKTEYAGYVPVKLAAVASLQTDGEFTVRADEQTLSGAFTDSGGVTQIGGVPVELVSVDAASQSRLKMVSLGNDWESVADLSLVISNGNSDTESFNTLIESTYKADTVQHSASLRMSQEEAEGETTKDQLDLDYGYKRFLSEKWFTAGNAEYFTDELKGIDKRISLGAGAGYQFWDNSFGSLSTELGVSAVREELDGIEEDNPAVRWAVNYKRFLFAKRMELFHKHAVLFIPDSDRGEVLSSSTGTRYAFSDRIHTTARVDVNHETDPPPGNSKTDVTYTLGIGVKF